MILKAQMQTVGTRQLATCAGTPVTGTGYTNYDRLRRCCQWWIRSNRTALRQSSLPKDCHKDWMVGTVFVINSCYNVSFLLSCRRQCELYIPCFEAIKNYTYFSKCTYHYLYNDNIITSWPLVQFLFLFHPLEQYLSTLPSYQSSTIAGNTVSRGHLLWWWRYCR